MGKAARLKRQRREAAKRPPRVGRQRPFGGRAKLVWGASAAVVIVIGIVVGVLLATRSSPEAPPSASPSAADRGAAAALVKAADAVGFYPTTEPGVGRVESQPASAAQPPSNPSLLAVGSKAPAFSLKTPQGQRVGLADFRGKAVLLEFFATWCPHCNAEAPHLRALYASLPKSRYAFVAVNADGEDVASVFAYHRYFGLAFPALLDPSSRPGSFNDGAGAPGPISTSYQVQSYPTFYVLDAKGQIVWRSDGEQPDALMRQELAKAAARG